ncbi:MAG: glycoside hydrolase family 5 protein [Saprospiraceae bacterium]
MSKRQLPTFLIRFSVYSIALVGLVISTSCAQNDVQLSRIMVKGNQFVDEAGKTMVFRGLNTSDPDKLATEGQWNQRYFQEMKNWGATVVRFPIHPTAWEKRGKKDYLQLLDEGIKWATELNMYVIIDWHSIGNLKTEQYQAPMYQTDLKQTLKFWTIIAKRYGDNPTVAFYELFNEPTLYGGKLGDCTWAQWKEMMEAVIMTIRKKGGKGVPLVAGFNWAYDLTAAMKEPINAEGIGYVSHPYPQKRAQPWEAKWTADWGNMKEKYPLILTEIGFCEPEAKGAHIPVISDESYGAAITDYCDKKDISYIVWVFDPLWSPMLFLDWDFTPSRQGRYFKEKMSSY